MKNKEQIAKIWDVLDSLNIDVLQNKKDISRIDEVLSVSNLWEPQKPKLKQLDQSVFDGLDERWVAASVEENGIVRLYLSNENNPYDCEYHLAGTKYDTTDWQSSLIERDIAKELTGSELVRAMLERGDKFVVCKLADTSEADAISNSMEKLVTEYDGDGFYHELADSYWYFAVPINNQGEPLTASEVGL